MGSWRCTSGGHEVLTPIEVLAARLTWVDDWQRLHQTELRAEEVQSEYAREGWNSLWHAFYSPPTSGNREKMRTQKAASVEVMMSVGGPTHCGTQGSTSSIDHFLIPKEAKRLLGKVRRCWRLGRAMQLAPCQQALDLMELHHTFVQRRNTLQREEGNIEQHSEERAPDKLWSVWMTTLQSVALRHFSRDKRTECEVTKRASLVRREILAEMERESLLLRDHGGMSATCRDHTATAEELLVTYDELGVDYQNVRQEAKDDIRKVVRRLERSAKRKAGPTAECADRSADPVAFSMFLLRPSPGKKRHWLSAKFRLCVESARLRLKGRNGTGLTPTIATLSVGHVLDKHNGKVELAGLRIIHFFCSGWRNVFGALLEEGF